MDFFDDLLHSTCGVYRRKGGTHNSYGIPDQQLTAVEENVSCRLSTHGAGKETEDPKQVAIEHWVIFMRPRAYRMNEVYFLIMENRFFRIISVLDPREHDSTIVHHLEIFVDEVMPSDVVPPLTVS